jgi:predicted transcriptional regulator
MMPTEKDNKALIEMTVDIVASYVSNNVIPKDQISELINIVYQSFNTLGNPTHHTPEVLEPAVSVKKSVTYDYIICLEDGKKFKSLKRHLKSTYGMTPEDYRAKWNLPSDYPMVAPSYSEKRSQLANKMGLGQKSVAARPGKSKN